MTKKVYHVCDKEAEIAVIKEKVDEIHKALMGNGRPGLIEKWNQLEGSISTWKWLAGAGVGTSGLAILLSLFSG